MSEPTNPENVVATVDHHAQAQYRIEKPQIEADKFKARWNATSDELTSGKTLAMAEKRDPFGLNLSKDEKIAQDERVAEFREARSAIKALQARLSENAGIEAVAATKPESIESSSKPKPERQSTLTRRLTFVNLARAALPATLALFGAMTPAFSTRKTVNAEVVATETPSAMYIEGTPRVMPIVGLEPVEQATGTATETQEPTEEATDMPTEPAPTETVSPTDTSVPTLTVEPTSPPSETPAIKDLKDLLDNIKEGSFFHEGPSGLACEAEFDFRADPLLVGTYLETVNDEGDPVRVYFNELLPQDLGTKGARVKAAWNPQKIYRLPDGTEGKGLLLHVSRGATQGQQTIALYDIENSKIVVIRWDTMRGSGNRTTEILPITNRRELALAVDGRIAKLGIEYVRNEKAFFQEIQASACRPEGTPTSSPTPTTTKETPEGTPTSSPTPTTTKETPEGTPTSSPTPDRTASPSPTPTTTKETPEGTPTSSPTPPDGTETRTPPPDRTPSPSPTPDRTETRTPPPDRTPLATPTEDQPPEETPAIPNERNPKKTPVPQETPEPSATPEEPAPTHEIVIPKGLPVTGHGPVDEDSRKVPFLQRITSKAKKYFSF